VKAIFRKLGARDRAHALARVLGTAMPTISLPGT
jgi:DNA-binding CsgD family transcriptional regulator